MVVCIMGPLMWWLFCYGCAGYGCTPSKVVLTQSLCWFLCWCSGGTDVMSVSESNWISLSCGFDHINAVDDYQLMTVKLKTDLQSMTVNWWLFFNWWLSVDDCRIENWSAIDDYQSMTANRWLICIWWLSVDDCQLKTFCGWLETDGCLFVVLLPVQHGCNARDTHMNRSGNASISCLSSCCLYAESQRVEKTQRECVLCSCKCLRMCVCACLHASKLLSGHLCCICTDRSNMQNLTGSSQIPRWISIIASTIVVQKQRGGRILSVRWPLHITLQMVLVHFSPCCIFTRLYAVLRCAAMCSCPSVTSGHDCWGISAKLHAWLRCVLLNWSRTR